MWGLLLIAGSLMVLAGVVVLGAPTWGGLGGSPSSGPQSTRSPVQVDEEVPVTAMHHGRAVANNSPELAAPSPGSRLVAAAFRRDAPAFGCGLQLSGSAGRGWQPARPVTEATLPEGVQSCYAPEVGFGPDGRLYYLFAGLAGRSNRPAGVFLTSSDDGGQSFTAPEQVLGERNFSVRMAVDADRGERGRVYLAWLHATSEPALAAMPPAPNPIQFAASTDGGRSWSQPQQVNTEGQQRVAGPAMTVAPDGTIYVAYYDLRDDERDYKALEGPVYEGEWSVVLARSTDGGETFETTVVDDAVRSVERVMLIFTMAPPALAAGDDGRVCVGWPQAHEDHGDVSVRCSADRGQSWGEPARANQDPGDSGAIHLLPQLEFSPTGRLDATFLARNPRGFQHTYYAASHDDGRSFTDHQQVTSRSSSSSIGQRYTNNAAARGKVEFGSRLGLHAGESQTLVMWPDTRNSRRGTTGQDLFAAHLTRTATNQSPSVGVLAGGAGLLVGGLLAATAALLVRRRRTHPTATPAADEADDTATADDGWQASVGRWGGRRLGWTVAVLAGLAVAAAGMRWLAQPPAPAQLPPDPPQLTVTHHNDGIEVARPVAPGRVVVKVINRDDTAHGLTMVPLGDDEPPIGDLLTDDTAQLRAPYAGMPPLEPGETARIAIDLFPERRYALYDPTPNPDDPHERLHARTGWHAEIRPISPVPTTPNESATPPVSP